ncbi:MAG: CRISPR-associated endoribonuclease Cas6 [Candidatus Heimdallarchaeota archaeon]|nr:CRISPR-associated endoribonuclease Cas6 [Candidatus Heimdallarchaeota archaeon]
MTIIYTYTIYFHINSDFKLYGFSGRVAHGAFLRLCEKLDPTVSPILHNQKRSKSFSLTHIQVDKRKNLASFSLSTADDEISKLILSLIAEQSNLEIYIGDTHHKLSHIQVQRIELPISEKFDMFRVFFNTPTFFSSPYRKSKIDAYPDLTKIWRSMIKNYSRIVTPISDIDQKSLVELCIKNIDVFQHKFHSVEVKQGKNRKQRGFKGEFSARIENTEGLDILPSILALATIWGVGGKTTQGFGQIYVKKREREDENTKKNPSGTE